MNQLNIYVIYVKIGLLFEKRVLLTKSVVRIQQMKECNDN